MEIIYFNSTLPFTISTGQVIFLIVFFLILFIPFFKIAKEEKKEKEEEEKKSKDNLLFEPETEAYITLEEAESGEWHEPDEEQKKHTAKLRRQYMDENEILLNKFYSFLITQGYERERIKNTINTLSTVTHSPFKLSDFNPDIDKLDFLKSTVIISQYPSQSIKDIWTLNNKTIFSVGNNLVFWVKVNHASGHYFMKKLTDVDRFLGKLLHKDDIHLKKHRVFTVKRGFDIAKAKKIFEKFDNEKNLQLELIDDNLLIRVFALPNREDFERINKLI